MMNKQQRQELKEKVKYMFKIKSIPQLLQYLKIEILNDDGRKGKDNK